MKIDLSEGSGRKDCFGLPENYFEDFQLELNERIDALEAEKAATRLTPFTRLKPYLYFAAMLALMFAVIEGLAGKDRDRTPDALSYLESVEELPAENEITAEDILMSTLGASDLMYYLYEDSLDE